MSAWDAFIGWLRERPAQAGATLDGWRVEIAESAAIRGGIRDSKLGGPYEAPGASTRLSGSLVATWSDGLVTRAALDRAAIEAPSACLAGWRELAVPERRPVVFAPPAQVPCVQVFDADLARAIVDEPATLLQWLADARAQALGAEVARLDATLRASTGPRIVATSAGFECTWQETAFGLELWTEEIAEAAFVSRRAPRAEEARATIDDVIERGRRLRRDDGLPPTAAGVIFMPAATEALLGRFFPRALAGRSIVDGRSPFTLADLDNGRQILRSDLSLVVDTTRPFALASGPCSSDGVPGGRVAVVSRGRLAEPILDLAGSVDLGRPPTPSPRGRPLLLLESTRGQLILAEGLARLWNGVVVRELPGLHTQGAQRWSYALVVPDAEAVRAGAPGGRASVRLRGNILEQLNAETTRLIAIPGEPNPALLVTDGIALEPA